MFPWRSKCRILRLKNRVCLKNPPSRIFHESNLQTERKRETSQAEQKPSGKHHSYSPWAGGCVGIYVIGKFNQHPTEGRKVLYLWCAWVNVVKNSKEGELLVTQRAWALKILRFQVAFLEYCQNCQKSNAKTSNTKEFFQIIKKKKH